jgi:hypothetical protein
VADRLLQIVVLDAYERLERGDRGDRRSILGAVVVLDAVGWSGCRKDNGITEESSQRAVTIDDGGRGLTQ